MANGYLGKISAIVSANTADFDSKLSKSAAEVRKFAGSMQGTLTSAQTGAGTALRGIYTEAQKVERALQAVATQKLRFKGFDTANLEGAVAKMQSLYSATEQVTKPLASAIKGFNKLSMAVQGEFNAALQVTQASVENLSAEIDRTAGDATADFTRLADRLGTVARQVDATTAAMSRLKEVGSMASGLATGQEIRFQRPELSAELQRSATLQSQAAQMSPAAITSNGVASLVAQQRAAAMETERLVAALERESLLINGDVASATAAYQSQLSVLRQLNSELEQRIGSEAAASKSAADAANAEIALIQRREMAGKQAEIERQSQAQRSADVELAVIQRREQAEKAAEVERQAQAQRAAEAEIALIQRREEAGKAAEVERQAQAQRAADVEIALLQRREQAAKAAELGGATNLGTDIEDPRRQLGVLEGSITSLKSKIDTLPESLRAQFVLAIRDAEREFIRLSTAAVPVAGEIEAARRRMTLLTQEATRAGRAMNFANSFGGQGTTGIRLGLDERILRGYEGSLGALQGALMRTQAAARGPAVAAFNNLRNAIAEAMAAGTLEEPATRQRIQQLQQVAVQTTSRAGGGSVSRIQQEMQRAGDIGRGGFDNLSLAANQAAFAIDDFLSSTGGFDQKLRAVSNNITQMAFVLGGTTGLFVGLGAALVGQALVGLVRWANSGRTAEDQTKALNDSLARQKSLVEGLAQAFKSLGDSMSRGAFSTTGDMGQQFNESVKDIRRKQKELRESRVAELDPGFQQREANIARDKRELETEQDPGRRVTLRQRIREAESANNELPDALANRPPQLPGAEFETQGMTGFLERMQRWLGSSAAVTPAGTGPLETPEAIRGALAQEALRNIATRDEPGGRVLTQAEKEERANRLAARAGDTFTSQRDAIQEMIGQLRPLSERREFGYFQSAPSAAATESIGRLQSLLEQLEAPFHKLLDELAVSLIEASRGPAESIRNAQESVAEAIKAGIPGARLFGLELDNTATALQSAYKKLEKAAEGKDPETNRTLDSDERKKLVDEAQAQIADLQARRADIERQADALRYERTVDPQRQADARMERARSNLGAAGLENGQIARRMREIEYERETIRQQAAKQENQNPMSQRLFAESEAALNAEIDAIEASTLALKMFSDALDRASNEAKGNLNSAQQAADEARRADLGEGSTRSQEERKRAADDLERQRTLDRDAQRELENQRAREEEIKRGPEFQRMREIDDQLLAGGSSADEQEKLRQERADLEAKVEPQLQAGREKAEKAVEASTREEERRKSAARGSELARNPDEKFAAETQTGMRDIRAYYEARAEANNGLRPAGDAEAQANAEKRYMEERDKEARTATRAGRGREAFLTEREKFSRDIREGLVKDMTEGAISQAGKNNIVGRGALLRKGIQNQMEQVAPMLANFEEQRQNARLQGPSRAALQVSDVSTSQGAAELTRLLRGDDSAKDVNLAELRKQTQKFDALIEAVKQQNPGVLL